MDSSLASASCRSLFYFIFHRDSYAYGFCLVTVGSQGWDGKSRVHFVEKWNSKLAQDEYKAHTLVEAEALRQSMIIILKFLENGTLYSTVTLQNIFKKLYKKWEFFEPRSYCVWYI
jgi:hypothetical protein